MPFASPTMILVGGCGRVPSLVVTLPLYPLAPDMCSCTNNCRIRLDMCRIIANSGAILKRSSSGYIRSPSTRAQSMSPLTVQRSS